MMYLKSRIFFSMLHLINIMHYIWELSTHLWWRLNGLTKKIEANMAGTETMQPAQVLKVLFRNPFLKTAHATPQTYFTVHERFAPADIVLNNRMHLLSVTSETATFTEVDCDILDVRKFPFTSSGQTSGARRLVVLPVKYFYELADNIDLRDRRVVWMFHTARCGSTAWAQVFNSLPGWTVFSEPQAVFYSIMHGDHGHYSAESYSKTPECKRMVAAAVKMHIRHAPAGGSVFWKGAVYEEYLMETIADSFPEHKMLVGYRDSFPSICSFYRLFHDVEFLRYQTEVILSHDISDEKWWGHLPNLYIWTNGCDYHFYKKIIAEAKPKVCVEWNCFMWSARASAIKRAIQNGVKAQPINYNSLMKDRKCTIQKVFNYLDLPSHYIDIACGALESDSQAGIRVMSWDSRTKDVNTSEWSKDPDVVKRCNMILEAFDLPDLRSPLDFSGSF